MPGIYYTWGTDGNGYDIGPNQIFFAPRSGQRIIGSGMFSTIIRFVWDTAHFALPASDLNYHPGQGHYMIRSGEYLSSFELSDVTLDCNLQNTPKPFTPTKDSGYDNNGNPIVGTVSLGPPIKVTSSTTFFTADIKWVGATITFPDPNNPSQSVLNARIMERLSNTEVRISNFGSVSAKPFQIFGMRFAVTALSVRGDNIRVRGVRVINFGTRTPFQFDGLAQPPPGPSSPNRTYEGFPLRVEGRTAGQIDIVSSESKTATSSGGTVNATGAIFTQAMIGSTIRFLTSEARAKITGFTSATQVSVIPSITVSNPETFQILTDLDRPSCNSVIEDCIFEQPYPGPGREVTCTVLGGGLATVNDPVNKLHLQPFGSVLRNCYFNFDYINPRPGNPVKVCSSSFEPGKVTVNTEFPADVQVDDYVEIYGCNAVSLNGRHKIAELLPADSTSKLVLGFKKNRSFMTGGREGWSCELGQRPVLQSMVNIRSAGAVVFFTGTVEGSSAELPL